MAVDNYVLYIFIFKISTIISGIFSIYLDYKLFVKGIFTDSGEMEGSFGTTKIGLKKAAPGTFFSLFGSIIICYAVFSGFTVNFNRNGKVNNFEDGLPETTANKTTVEVEPSFDESLIVASPSPYSGTKTDTTSTPAE